MNDKTDGARKLFAALRLRTQVGEILESNMPSQWWTPW